NQILVARTDPVGVSERLAVRIEHEPAIGPVTVLRGVLLVVPHRLHRRRDPGARLRAELRVAPAVHVDLAEVRARIARARREAATLELAVAHRPFGRDRLSHRPRPPEPPRP